MRARPESARVATRILVAFVLATALTAAGCASGRSPVPESRGRRTQAATGGVATLPASGATSGAEASRTPETPLTFAVIGDYGTGDSAEREVTRLVSSWKPAIVVTLGDNYYSSAGGSGEGKYARSVGAFYGRWLARHEFFPLMGNHDYSNATPSPGTYLTYFELPGPDRPSTSGNERYYDFVDGPVHFFMLNSNSEEPGGTSSTSTQARWLQTELAASTSRWNIVCDHHPPYSSDHVHGSTTHMQWPFRAWGADIVLSGHAHDYERIMRAGFPYVVNGLGGASRYSFARPVSGSVVRFWSDWGAQKVTASGTMLKLEFYDVGGHRVDSYTLTK